MTNLPLIGGHVSAAGGLKNAIANGTRIGATAIQIFGASPRQWKALMPPEAHVEGFKEAQSESEIKSVFLHAAYLVNLASANPESRDKSVDSLCNHMRIAQAIGAQGLIFHMGSNKNRDEGLALTVEGIKRVLDQVDEPVQLIMENSAGGGSKLGADFDELAFLHKTVSSERLKICLDTAHAFESNALPEFTESCTKKVFDKWESDFGLDTIVAIHVNDSKTVAGSFHDRHENLGEGHIGLDGFNTLTAEKRLHHASWMLEVPGFDNEGPDARNVDLLRGCFA
ncbi:hypothetical protein CO046_05370 [Candidatus Peregrinibacteria bacterium CG_4_9_14_0_2_um_filter_53_11]|nr:MAG: hypothetical protein CO046_05370 [Candidatus Peregrinibacteria bacterium CG_4_9_14_0_2_um_filter_53_11]